MTFIPDLHDNDHAISRLCSGFIKRFNINGLLRAVGATKEKGIPAYELFAYLMGLVFTGKNHYTLTEICCIRPGFAKDTVYRFLKKATVSWERLIRRLSAAVVFEVQRLTSDERKDVLIIDDSPYSRNRSKKVEMLSWCYDHNENKNYKGFYLLTLGWSDGQTFLPFDFRLLAASKDKSLIQGPRVKDDGRTIATKRRNDARRGKPKAALEMLEAAKGTAAQAKHVLFDSWFAFPSFILSVTGLGYHAVARVKNHKNYRYTWNGADRPVSEIYKASKKRRGKSRYLLSTEVAVRHEEFDEPVPARLVYVRERGNRKKWIAFICTDMSLTEDEVIALYGKRWDIETYHKMIKSYLQLAREFQARSFDALVAHTAIVLVRYMLLSLEGRENRDSRSFGELFYDYCKELDDISFAYALSLVISTLEQCMDEYLFLTKEQVEVFLRLFIIALPAFIRDRLQHLVCES